MEIWLLFPWWCKSCNVIIGKSCKRRMKGNHFARLFLCCCRVRKQKLIFVQGFLLTCNHANQNHPIFVILAAKKMREKALYALAWHNSQRSMCVPPPTSAGVLAPLHVWHKALELLHIWLGPRRKNAFLRHGSILKHSFCAWHLVLLCLEKGIPNIWKVTSSCFFVRAWSL